MFSEDADIFVMSILEYRNHQQNSQHYFLFNDCLIIKYLVPNDKAAIDRRCYDDGRAFQS